MYGLKHRSLSRTQIAARGHPQAALQSGSKIADDVAKHVVGDEDIKSARIAHHLHGERVHVHALRFDLRILRGDLLEHALPQASGMSHGVRFVAHQHSPPRRAIQLLIARAILKRVADDAFDALARVDVFLDCNFIRRSLLEHSSKVAVNALGVLANHNEIDVFWFDAFERTKRRIHQPYRPDIGKQVHLAAHAQQDFLRMNVRGHARIAESADQYGVEIPIQHSEAIRRDRSFVGEVVIGSPVEAGYRQIRTGSLDHSYRLRNDLFPDAITGNHGNSSHSYCAHARNVSTAANHS